MAWTRGFLTKVLDSFPRAFQVSGGRIAQRCASWAELANTFQFIIYRSFYPDCTIWYIDRPFLWLHIAHEDDMCLWFH